MEKEEEDAMEGHAMVPLQGLRLELPGGEIAVGYSTDASALQEEISSLRSRRRHVDRRRREALDRLIDLKGSVRVFCRVRPLVRTNYSFNTESPPVTVVEQERIAVKSAGIKKEFSADRVFGQESTQEDVFQEVKPVLRSALDGHNVCVLAYGQTGTGKTYTMEGTDGKLGIVPRAIQELFSRASEDGSCAYSFSMSMLEVYLGSLRDLLAPRQPLFRPTECKTACNLSILATKNGAVEVEGLTDVSTPDVKKASQWYRRGRRARSTSWTNVNDVSSRSHCLTRITIRRRRRRGGGTEGGGVSKLWLVDLGGSERLLKTGASGLTMDEGRAINLSLSALGDVIAALRRKRGHVPYRNSKLTQILSDSLGDGSKVLMVVHVSPSEDDVGETVCSLNFAKRARSIESNREIPQDLKTLRQKRLAELDREIRAAEEELERLDEQIRRAEETSLEEEEEKKKAKLLASSVCQALSDGEKGSPRSTLVVVGHTDATESPCATEKARSRRPASRGSAAPHFMSSTVCSRQRRCAGSHCVGKPRLTTMSVNRYPAAAAAAELGGSQSQSQSFGYSGCKNNAAKVRSAAAPLSSGAPRMRCLPAKSDQINVISNSSVDSTAASAPRRRESCFGSRPVRQRAAAPLHQHRRRMSSLT